MNNRVLTFERREQGIDFGNVAFEIVLIVDAFGAFAHGHSYVGHATVAAAGLAVMQVLEDENLLENVNRTGVSLRSCLRDVFKEHPHVGDIRGRGLLVGIELVEDRETRAGIRKELGVPAAVRSAAMKNGLICYPGGGTADGIDGAHILLAPPFICQTKHIDELVGKLEKVLAAVDFALSQSMFSHQKVCIIRNIETLKSIESNKLLFRDLIGSLPDDTRLIMTSIKNSAPSIISTAVLKDVKVVQFWKYFDNDIHNYITIFRSFKEEI